MGTVEEETVWQLWDCSDCGKKGVSCEHNICTRCGHRRTFDEFEARYLPGDINDDGTLSHAQQTVTAAQASALEQAGLNWFCVVCRADNLGNVLVCYNCAAPRGVTDAQLREGAGAFKTFEAYEDGDQGATASLVEQFGPYAGMRAAQGDAFQMEDVDHATQLKRAAGERDAFGRQNSGPSRPEWDEADLPSSVQSMAHTHPNGAPLKKKGKIGKFIMVGGATAVGGGTLIVAGLMGLALLSPGDTPVQAKVKTMRWERAIAVEQWTDVTRSDWQHNIKDTPEKKPVDGSGERAGKALIDGSCNDKHWKNEDYQCGTKIVGCTHDVPDGHETYSCPKTESYPCSKQESYSCPETERYSCTKQKKVSCGTEKYGCRMRDNGNGSATRVCQTRTKYCNQSVSDTCTRTNYKTCTRTVSKTCTRTVTGVCTRTIYKKAHAGGDEVPKMCTRALERPYCDYRTQEWRDVDTFRSKGKGTKKIAWPKIPTKKQVRTTRTSEYSVTLSFIDKDEKKRTHTFHPKNAKAYRSWKKGKPAVVVVNRQGEVAKDSVQRGTVQEFEAKQKRK